MFEYDEQRIAKITRGLSASIENGTYADMGVYVVGDARQAMIAIDDDIGLSVAFWKTGDCWYFGTLPFGSTTEIDDSELCDLLNCMLVLLVNNCVRNIAQRFE